MDNNLLNSVQQFFETEGWSMYPIEGQAALGSKVSGENGIWTYLALVDELQQEIICYSIFPAAVPSKQRATIAEFLTRTNYGLSIGNFEFDLTDGEIRYKTSLCHRNEPLSDNLLKHIVYINVAMMDQYFVVLQQLNKAALSIEEALIRLNESQ